MEVYMLCPIRLSNDSKLINQILKFDSQHGLNIQSLQVTLKSKYAQLNAHAGDFVTQIIDYKQCIEQRDQYI